MTHRLWGYQLWQPLFAGLNSSPPVEGAIKVTSRLCGPNLYALKKLVNKRRGNDHKVQVARVPTSCSPMPDRCPRDIDIKAQLFNYLPPTCASIAGTILDVHCETNALKLCIASGSQQSLHFAENINNCNPNIHHLLKARKPACLSIERQVLDRCRTYSLGV